jgi:hypothetical protein
MTTYSVFGVVTYIHGIIGSMPESHDFLGMGGLRARLR